MLDDAGAVPPGDAAHGLEFASCVRAALIVCVACETAAANCVGLEMLFRFWSTDILCCTSVAVC